MLVKSIPGLHLSEDVRVRERKWVRACVCVSEREKEKCENCLCVQEACDMVMSIVKSHVYSNVNMKEEHVLKRVLWSIAPTF
jgi:hypothetical protein